MSFLLCLAAALCAEHIPLCFLLISVALLVSFRSTYYRTCPRCGAHLDPGEVCDCLEEKEEPFGATNTERPKADETPTKKLSVLCYINRFGKENQV